MCVHLLFLLLLSFAVISFSYSPIKTSTKLIQQLKTSSSNFQLSRIATSKRRSPNLLYAIPSTTIALTREDGSNDKLMALLKGYKCYEIPCIMFEKGEDLHRLPNEILQNDLIIITSPQAAKVFINSFETSNNDNSSKDLIQSVKVVSIGKGTSKPLLDKGIVPVFEPSDSTAETLAKELPLSFGKRVLYPSSAIAENTLVKGLEERGFSVRIQ